ncbi:MAG: OmpA/MotB [Verrucomicrobiaceae bacterium]|nr:OmpA/MotB [Verrucomicrobiaceae bacterium]
MDIRSNLFCPSRLSRSQTLRAIALCGLAAIGCNAHAEGLYVLASGGQSHFDLNLDRNDFDADIEGTGLTVTSSKFDKSDTGYKLQLGYQFNENFALEGGYIDLGQAEYSADLATTGITGNYKARFEAKGWNLDALLTLPINAGFSLFLKGGVIRAEVKGSEKVSATDGTATASDSISSTDKKVRANYGLGVAYNFYNNFSARAEIERFSNLKSNNDNGFDVQADVDLYSVGLSYQF